MNSEKTGGRRECHAAARGALEEALQDQEGLMHFLDRRGILAHGDGQRADAHRAAVELVDHRFEDPLVHFIKALRIDFDHRQRGIGRLAGDRAVPLHLGIIADPAQQGIRHSRGAAGAGGDFHRALVDDRDIQQPGGALDDLRQLLLRVVIEAVHQPESGA